MIFLVIITIIFLFYYKKYYKKTGLSPLLIFFIATFFLSFFCLECIYRGTDFFFSDEVSYINAASDKLPSRPDRFLWYFINDLILNHDISLNGFALKVINIPFAAGFLLVLWYIFRHKKVFLIPVILPYFAFIATKNIRDIPIFLFTALTILLFHHRKPIYMVLSLISLGMLFLLRPFAAVIVFIISLLQICLLTIKSLKGLAISKRFSQKILILVVIVMIISPFAVTVVRHSIVSHYNYFIYTTFAEGYEMLIKNRVQNDPRYASGNKFRDFCVASVRYAVTPIPTSILGRLMKGGSEYWGLVDDLIRVVNQFGYYFMLVFLILNVRYIPAVFLKLTPAGKAFILSFLTYWPIYSYHLYGVTHQRLKLPLQIVVFLIAISVFEYKKSKSMNRIKKRIT
jgi:hypothetical protein